MLSNLQTPGVYYERIDPPPAIGLHRADIAGFVGIAARGPLHHPVQVESWTQFTGVFGDHLPQGYLAYAVEGFFANGGRTAFVVRVADPQQAAPAGRNLSGPGGPVLRLEASSPGVWGQAIVLRTVRTGPNTFTLILRLGEHEPEIWRNLPLADLDAVQTQLNHPVNGSRLVRAVPPNGQGLPAQELVVFGSSTASGCLLGGQDGLATLTVNHFAGRSEFDALIPYGLTTLETVDPVGLVAMPDALPKLLTRLPPPIEPPLRCDALDAEPVPAVPVLPQERPPDFSPVELRTLYERLIAHCTTLRNRFAIIDPPYTARTPPQVVNWRSAFDTSFGAVYYPWLMVPDPLKLDGLLRRVPPSGHIAGIYARSDQQIGVHKPPANALIERAQDVVTPLDDIAHGSLNSEGVNVIRAYPGRGIRVAGARTLAGAAATEWRYVNVRRLFLMIEEAIEESAQWLVFEPGGPALWGQVERVVRDVLRRMWQRGMLDGTKPGDAFRVRCDATTNPPDQTALGRMICEIELRAPYPAEFVIVRVGFTENGISVLE